MIERDDDIVTVQSKAEGVQDALTQVHFDRVAYANSITTVSNEAGDNTLIIANGTFGGPQELNGNQTLQGGKSTILVTGLKSGTTPSFTAPASRATYAWQLVARNAAGPSLPSLAVLELDLADLHGRLTLLGSERVRDALGHRLRGQRRQQPANCCDIDVFLPRIVDVVLARMRPRLVGARVTSDLPVDLPDVSVDPVQIDQVLTNLLENASKFSPPMAPITVSAARWRDVVEIRVADHGIGIPPEDRERLFEPFVRADHETTTGSGLGLSISRAIVESHGGQIWIEGTPGGGATVVVQLPMVQ